MSALSLNSALKRLRLEVKSVLFSRIWQNPPNYMNFELLLVSTRAFEIQGNYTFQNFYRRSRYGECKNLYLKSIFQRTRICNTLQHKAM